MAKKTRRVKSPRLTEAQLVRPAAGVTRETPVVAAELAEELLQKPARTDFRQEYHYVVKDLQRIGILAAAMLSGLVVLSLIL